MSRPDAGLALGFVHLLTLDEARRAAVDRIFSRLQAYDVRLQALRPGRYGLGPISQDKDRIDVSADDLWMMVNLGDDRIHLSAWESLSDGHRERYASWFSESLDAAARRYGEHFYDFMALHLAGVQTVYAVQGVAWVYSNRHMFNVDRDAERLVVTYLTETDRALFNRIFATCGFIRGVYDARYGSWYSMLAYGDHVTELTDPRDPSGQIYMICRHMEQAEIRKVMFNTTFAAEIEMLEIRRASDGTTILGM